MTAPVAALPASEVDAAVGLDGAPAWWTLEERAHHAAAQLDALAARGGDAILVAAPTESLHSLAGLLRALADLSREATP